jgi:hypothetical protein
VYLHRPADSSFSRDIVDTEPADGNILKMLIGAVNKWADKQNDSTTPARPG